MAKEAKQPTKQDGKVVWCSLLNKTEHTQCPQIQASTIFSLLSGCCGHACTCSPWVWYACLSSWNWCWQILSWKNPWSLVHGDAAFCQPSSSPPPSYEIQQASHGSAISWNKTLCTHITQFINEASITMGHFNQTHPHPLGPSADQYHDAESFSLDGSVHSLFLNTNRVQWSTYPCWIPSAMALLC